MWCDGIFIGLKNFYWFEVGFYIFCCFEIKFVIFVKFGIIVFIIVWIFFERFNGFFLGMMRW